MKKNEIAKIVEAENSAWETLCEARMVSLENSGLSRGCGYDLAREYTDAETERERAAWGALSRLLKDLGIEPNHTEYSSECQKAYREYATIAI